MHTFWCGGSRKPEWKGSQSSLCLVGLIWHWFFFFLWMISCQNRSRIRKCWEQTRCICHTFWSAIGRVHLQPRRSCRRHVVIFLIKARPTNLFRLLWACFWSPHNTRVMGSNHLSGVCMFFCAFLLGFFPQSENTHSGVWRLRWVWMVWPGWPVQAVFLSLSQ